jgi:hypothetical protein
LVAQLEQQQRKIQDNAANLTSKADLPSSPVDTIRDDYSPENLARKQLMAELREASNFMAESVTPEAAKFWRNHVIELQARLRALHGEGGSVPAQSVVEAVNVIKSNQQLLSTYGSDTDTGYQPPPPLQNIGYQAPLQNELSATPRHLQNQLSTSTTPLHQNASSGKEKTKVNMDPSLEGVPMVDVVAPADLPGGYMFEAEIEERRFLATVPAGGVRKGETFCCYMRDLEKVGSEIPVGSWRDNLTDCFQHGTCHPMVWNALYCPLRKYLLMLSRIYTIAWKILFLTVVCIS